MALIVFGLNHNSAPLEVLAKTVIAENDLGDALSDCKAAVGADEVVILSTCNRCEIYAVLNKDGDEAAAVAAWLRSYCGVLEEEISGCCFTYRDKAAIHHLMRVASSVDSMIVGEPQILGQVKSAYRAALAAKSSAAVLSRLFESSIAVAKKVRSETELGKHPVSYVSAAVKACRRLFENLSDKRLLLLGTGEMIELTARHFQSQRVAAIGIAGRSSDKVRALAAEFDAQALDLNALDDTLPNWDIVVSCTASTAPIIYRDTIAAALKQRKHSPMCIVDMGLPRDIDPAVGELPDVYLYALEYLANIVDDNKQARLAAAAQAETAVRLKADEYAEWVDSRKAADTIAELLARADGVRAQALAKALQALHRGKSPEEALTRFSTTLTGKLMHPAIETLKQAAERGHFELLGAIRRRLDEQPDEKE